MQNHKETAWFKLEVVTPLHRLPAARMKALTVDDSTRKLSRTSCINQMLKHNYVTKSKTEPYVLSRTKHIVCAEGFSRSTLCIHGTPANLSYSGESLPRDKQSTWRSREVQEREYWCEQERKVPELTVDDIRDLGEANKVWEHFVSSLSDGGGCKKDLMWNIENKENALNIKQGDYHQGISYEQVWRTPKSFQKEKRSSSESRPLRKLRQLIPFLRSARDLKQCSTRVVVRS